MPLLYASAGTAGTQVVSRSAKEVNVMFEKAIIDSSGRGGSKWKFAGLLVQCGMVAGVLLVPMIYPEVLSVRKLSWTMLTPPSPAPPPPEILPETHSAVQHQGSSMAAARRVVTVPTNTNVPIAQIDDGPPLLAPSVSANTIGNSFPTAGVVGAVSNTFASAPPVLRKPEAQKPKEDPPTKRVPVGGDVQAANIIHKVMPVYPPLAKQMRVSGLVRLQGVISREGRVQDLRIISGHGLLAQAALEAVRQWVYKPTLLNGQPVEVIAPIDVNFVLGQ
jgi:protein TonB